MLPCGLPQSRKIRPMHKEEDHWSLVIVGLIITLFIYLIPKPIL